MSRLSLRRKDGGDQESMVKIEENGNGLGKDKDPAEKEKRAPTMFQEPEANSLLDSFGF